MILIENRDGHMWNLHDKIIEIIEVAITHRGNIDISINAEGPCLRSCEFYNVLDSISDKFNIDKKRFVIFTANIEEFHDEYKIIIVKNIWLSVAQNNVMLPQVKNKNLRTVGCFIGKINWPRLILLAWLNKYFVSQSSITCHYDNKEISHQSVLDLDQCMIDFPDEINDVCNFLKLCPIQIDNLMTYNIVKYQSFKHRSSVIMAKFANVYADIFLELVCESYYSGLTFFPTEKTFRPILQMTPFVIFGPRGFLTNLQRCGFKTFGDYWDESYDDSNGPERVLAIRKVLEKIFAMSPEQLHNMYTHMAPILEYNRSRLLTMSSENLKLDRHK